MKIEIIDQETGNYNVFCQSYGKIIGINIEGHRKALDLEKDHLDNNGCTCTGTHKIQGKKDHPSI